MKIKSEYKYCGVTLEHPHSYVSGKVLYTHRFCEKTQSYQYYLSQQLDRERYNDNNYWYDMPLYSEDDLINNFDKIKKDTLDQPMQNFSNETIERFGNIGVFKFVDCNVDEKDIDKSNMYNDTL